MRHRETEGESPAQAGTGSLHGENYTMCPGKDRIRDFAARSLWALTALSTLALPGCAPGPVTPKAAAAAPRGNVTARLRLYAVPAPGIVQKPVPGVRFLVVDSDGKVLGSRTGNGSLTVTTKPSGFLSSSFSAQPGQPPPIRVGDVTVFAFAPHYRDTMVLNVLITPVPIGGLTEITMLPMVNPRTQNDANEPVVEEGYMHHLFLDALDQHYAARLGVTPSYLRLYQP